MSGVEDGDEVLRYVVTFRWDRAVVVRVLARGRGWAITLKWGCDSHAHRFP